MNRPGAFQGTRQRSGWWSLLATSALILVSLTVDAPAGQYENDARRYRAGCPDNIAPWACCTYGKSYCGYYVGGGEAFYSRRGHGRLPGEPRYSTEGTFGMDYDPPWSRVNLMWTHGRKYQGGEGQYEQNRHNYPFPNLSRR